MTPANDRSPNTLLIIDDDAVTADAFVKMLQTGGYRAVSRSNAVSGLEELERLSPAGLLLDLHLPVTDGLMLLRQLRAAPQTAHTSVAIVTGDYFMDDAVATEIGRLGARVYFKPVWEEDLLRIARDLVSKV